MSLLEAALEWAADGVPVFPVGKDKRPLCANGHKDASTEPESVKALFAAAPSAWGIGARMGRAAGLFAIDADTYKPGEAGASASAFITQLKQSGLLPETRVHKTVNGGVHYLFASDRQWPNCVPCLGVEVKGEGGYVIVPPTPGYTVEREGVAYAPQGLLQLLLQRKEASRGTSVDALKGQILSGESFHEAATSLAAKLAADGVPIERVQATLREALAASVAADPKHPRHDRWEALWSNQSGELARVVSSASNKFNPATQSQKLREAAIAAGITFNVPPPVNEGPAPEPEPDDITEWPFEGYFGDDARLNVLDQKFIAYPILAEGETAIISAAPKAGKTLIAQTLAMHIAAGADLGAIKIKESRPVIYFALEGQTAIKRRLLAWRNSVDPSGTILTHESFPFFVAERPLNLTTAEARKVLAAKVAAADRMFQERGFLPIGVVIYDTLTKLMPGGNQNQADDTSAVFSVIDDVRSLGIRCCNMFIHHDNRQGQTRGSTNIQAEPDILFGVKTNVDTGALELDIRMARSLDDDQTFSFRKVDTLLGKTPDGYEIRAPLAIPYDPISEPVAFQTDEALRKIAGEEDLLRTVAHMGLGSHAFSGVHKALSNKFTRDKYPVGTMLSRGANVQEYWAQMLPITGRVIDDRLILPHITRGKRGATSTSCIEHLSVKLIAVDLPQRAEARQG